MICKTDNCGKLALISGEYGPD